MPKILPNSQVTYEEDARAADAQVADVGAKLAALDATVALEHPADGTVSPPVGNDGEPGGQVAQLPPGELAVPGGPAVSVPAQDAAPAPEPAVHVPPRPPRRPAPSVTGSGGVTLPKPGATDGQ